MEMIRHDMTMTVTTSETKRIPLDDLVPSPHNKRRLPTKAELEDLAASLTAQGQLQNAVVRVHPENDSMYEILAGERRWRAAKLAGLDRLECKVVEADNKQAVLITCTENNQREDLSPLEEAAAIEELARAGFTTDEISANLGRSTSFVARRRSLMALSPTWLAVLGGGVPEGWEFEDDFLEGIQKLTASHLELIARFPPATQDAILEDLIPRGWQNGWKNRFTVPTVAHLRQMTGQFLRDLSAAPWKKDDAELLPAAGACNACPHRSSKKPVFQWDVNAASEGDKGAKRIVYLDGPRAGQTDWAKLRTGATSAPSVGKAKGQKKTLKEREAELETRRGLLRCELVREALSKLDGADVWELHAPGVLFQFACSFGISSAVLPSYGDRARSRFEVARGFEVAGETFARLVLDSIVRHLATAIRDQFYQKKYDRAFADHAEAAKLFKIDYEGAIWEEVKKRLPEPKSWAAERELLAKQKKNAKKSAKKGAKKS